MESSRGHGSVQLQNGKPSSPRSKQRQISYLHATSIFPALLLVICPIFTVVLSYTLVELKGDFHGLLRALQKEGVATFVRHSVLRYLLGNAKAWTIIGCFGGFELLLMRVLPGKKVAGLLTPNGNIPVYKANGLLAYVVSMATFFSLAFFKIINPVDVYDNYPYIIGALCSFSVWFVLGLYLKGRYAPSSSDNSISGDFIFDYFWGTELYPRVLGWDVKLFTNCRFGLMGWALLVICYAWKQYDSYGYVSTSMGVSVALQLIYLTKFYHWEMGYMKTLDIMHDRAGFMIVSGFDTSMCHQRYTYSYVGI